MILITGPPESGKSELAECLFDQVSPKVYVATLPRAAEHMAKIRRHERARRTKGWHTLEYSVRRPLPEQLRAEQGGGGLLVDGLVALLIRRTIAAASAQTDPGTLIREVAAAAFREFRQGTCMAALAVVVFSDRAWRSEQSTARCQAMRSWMEQYTKVFPDVTFFHGREGAQVVCPSGEEDHLLELAGEGVRRKLDRAVVIPGGGVLADGWYPGTS
ncbi:MAG TPA: bifunctional adenosylcobinamide kinase/adenosylcobinamide-phosphate guanylyltransferase [Thermoanaerobaculia bacterium]|jgi:adenosyl cobinamide kinase/adenosyl cobinamide phosphate guanylyltransferase|nr:bifunctional adenosylcobinamide kinase/adenosylcobinamide-phosphate guanylyltransferase [Thermoanaerobaculia bacterium]